MFQDPIQLQIICSSFPSSQTFPDRYVSLYTSLPTYTKSNKNIVYFFAHFFCTKTWPELFNQVLQNCFHKSAKKNKVFVTLQKNAIKFFVHFNIWFYKNRMIHLRRKCSINALTRDFMDCLRRFLMLYFSCAKISLRRGKKRWNPFFPGWRGKIFMSCSNPGQKNFLITARCSRWNILRRALCERARPGALQS